MFNLPTRLENICGCCGAWMCPSPQDMNNINQGFSVMNVLSKDVSEIMKQLTPARPCSEKARDGFEYLFHVYNNSNNTLIIKRNTYGD